ncbi:hypothetical protein THAOC_14433, partial [Thalassiosira oceanica]
VLANPSPTKDTRGGATESCPVQVHCRPYPGEDKPGLDPLPSPWEGRESDSGDGWGTSRRSRLSSVSRPPSFARPPGLGVLITVPRPSQEDTEGEYRIQSSFSLNPVCARGGIPPLPVALAPYGAKSTGQTESTRTTFEGVPPPHRRPPLVYGRSLRPSSSTPSPPSLVLRPAAPLRRLDRESSWRNLEPVGMIPPLRDDGEG